MCYFRRYALLTLGLIYCFSYAESNLTVVQEVYVQGIKEVTKSVKIDNVTDTKLFANQTILLGAKGVCLNPIDPAGKYLLENFIKSLYGLAINNINYVCIVNKPEATAFTITDTTVSIVLQSSIMKINTHPSIMDLIDQSNLQFSAESTNSNVLASDIQPNYCMENKNKQGIPYQQLVCQDAKDTDTNYILNINQPVKPSGKLWLSSNVQFANPSRKLENELKTPYPPLPKNLGNNLQPELLQISLNNNKPNDTPLLIYANNDAVCLQDNTLDLLKIGDNHSIFYEYFLPNTNPLIDSSLKCIINNHKDTTFSVDQQAGVLSLTLPLALSSSQNVNLGASNEPIYPSGQIYANSTNYQIGSTQAANGSSSTTAMNGNFTNTMATPIGSLMNSISANLSQSNQLTRNATYWQTDFPSSMTSLIIGDATPLTGSWGGQTPYAGMQYGSNEALRPNYFFTATPIISGLVNNPTTAEILLNGAQTNQLDLASGPFNLYNLPIVNGDGSVTVNLKSPSGTTYQSVTLPYYTSPKVLASTTYLYQYDIGIPQQQGSTGWNLSNYQTSNPVAATQHFIGITNNDTLEVRAETQANTFGNFGVSNNNIWLNKFATGVTAAFSKSESGMGTLLGFNISRQTSLPNSFGFGYTANVFSSSFAELGATSGQNYPIQQTLFANYVASNGLSINLGYSNDSSYSGKSMSLVNFTLMWQIIPKVLINSSTGFTNQSNTQTFASSLGVTITFDGSQSLASNYAYQQTQNQTTSDLSENYQYSAPSNLWGYNVGGNYSNQTQQTPTSVNGGGFYLFKNFNANGTATYTNSKTYAANGTISGNAVVSSHGVNFGQYSNLAFIVVKVGDLPNVGIKQNGTVVGSTDRNGVFVIPNVPAYLPQDIQVNATDLPFNVELDSYEKRIVAPLNGGARVTFIPVSYTPASAFLRYNDDKIPPSGFSASLYSVDSKDALETVYIIDNGAIQLTKFSEKLSYHLDFTVKEGTFSCPISKDNINKTDSNQYLTNLGTIQCHKI